MSTQHGHSGSLTYLRWKSMIQRCENPKATNYEWYGAKGVAVCDRWHSFTAFRQDMGECPIGMTLDRIKNSIGYEPGNCRWLTPAEQNRNRTNAVILTHAGQSKSATEWSNETGIGLTTILARRRLGWFHEKILTTPVVARKKKGAGVAKNANQRRQQLTQAAPVLLKALQELVAVCTGEESSHSSSEAIALAYDAIEQASGDSHSKDVT